VSARLGARLGVRLGVAPGKRVQRETEVNPEGVT